VLFKPKRPGYDISDNSLSQASSVLEVCSSWAQVKRGAQILPTPRKPYLDTIS
jgi:hypothetical protein